MNHGVLTSADVHGAYMRLYNMERACNSNCSRADECTAVMVEPHVVHGGGRRMKSIRDTTPTPDGLARHCRTVEKRGADFRR